MLLAAALCSILMLPVAWNARHSVNGADIAYIEVATHGLEWGPEHLLWNGYWSPAYPAILAAGLNVAHPARNAVVPLVHGIDWFVCVLTFFSFTFFFLNLLKWIEFEHPMVLESGSRLSAILAFGYTLLFVANLDPSLWHVRPDILLEGAVYLAAGMCVRISLPDARRLHYVALGATLALAYAAKAALFPLAVVLLLILFFRPVGYGFGRRGIVVAGISFFLAIAPLVAIQSYAKGRLTFGDSGNFNYAELVNGVSSSILWQGQMPGSRILVHPAKMVSSSPVILKFDGPFQGTLTDIYDRSYWYDGVKAHFNPRQQARVLLGSLGLDRQAQHDGINLRDLATPWLPLFGGVVALVVMGLRRRTIARAMGDHLWLFVWPVIASFTYACVVLQYRYLVPFIVLGWVSVFAAAWIALEPDKSTGILVTVAATLFLTSCNLWMKPLGEMIRAGITPAQAGASVTSENAAIAKKLEAMGIHPGDEIAYIRKRSLNYAAWLTGARFTQMVFIDPDTFSTLPNEEALRIEATLRANGAKALLSPGRPAFDDDAGWIAIEEHTNGYAETSYLRMLQ